MRRLPDKEGPNLSERDVESSNATLNTLFGGARKKSWMIGVGAPVRPSPRASTSRSAGPQSSLSQRSIATILPSPAPSDKPIPVVPSSPGNGDDIQRLIAYGENRRSSVSTPHGPSVNISPPDIGRESSMRETPAQKPPAPSKMLHAQPRRLIYPSEIVEAARPVVENPPLPSSVFLPSEDHQTSPEVASPNTRHVLQNTRPTLNLQGEVFVPSHEEASVSPLGSAPSVGPATQNTQWLRSFHASIEEIHTPVQTPTFTPRVPSVSTVPEAQSYSSVFPSNPHKRQRTQHAAMPSLRSRTISIDSHIASVGGFESLNYDLERPRFQLLERACKNEDWFYVALHQVFCVWDFDPNEVAQIVGFPSITILRTAFKNVSQLIRDNEQLAINHKKWFATFPSPLLDLLRTSEPYRSTVADVGLFLGRLATDWVPLSMDCSTRKYPPLVDELVGRLGLLSPILQGVVFTAARRNIEVTEGEFANRMEAIFKQDQMDHQGLATRYNTARPPTIKEVQDRNQKLVNEYLGIYSQFMEQRLTSSPALSTSLTSVVPGNGHFQPQSRPQPQSSRQVNMSDHAENRQQYSPPQQYQQRPSVQQPLTGPSNAILLDRRPENIGTQQVHLNNISPTLLQGLTVNSPIQQGFQLRSNNAPVPQQRQHSNSSYYPAALPNGTFQQGAVQAIDPSQVPQSISAQQYQQWVASQQPPQVQRQHQQQQIALQQMELMQRQQNHQPLMQQKILSQGAASLGRSTSRREINAPIGIPNPIHSRTNSVSSGGRQTPTANAGYGPGRPVGVGYRNDSLLSYDQTVQANAAKYNALPVLQRPLVPPLGYVHQSQPTNPDLTALHQAHLRSPRLVAADSPPSKITQDDPSYRYYQAVKGFAIQPTKINIFASLSYFNFMVSTADHNLTPGDHLRGPGQVATREFRNGTIQYRIRCVQMKQTEDSCPTSEWVVHDTDWPEGAYLDINSNHLETRRKNHHGKDLPIDITSYVRAGGPYTNNRITLSITRGRTKVKDVSYFIAVEAIEILGHATILNLCQRNHIPAGQTLESIKKSLAGPEDGDDDDFAMVVSDLAIDLADPFTSRIFETPVRGSSCLHRECFDLETFLFTRNSKPKHPEQPCMIDVWKCPLCSKDARPYSLRIDDFLASVRTSLDSQNLLDVKAIWIGPDGKWRPKVEERTGTSDPHDSDDSSDGEGAKKQQVARDSAQPSRSKRVIEVINLDD